MRKYKARFYQQMVNILFLNVIIAFLAPVCASAESVKQDVPGTVYVLNDGDDYQLDSAVSSFPTDKENTYGRFSLFGDIAAVSVNENVISYGIVSENVELHYDYDDVVLNAGEEDWHLVDEKSKTIDGTKRDSKILKGAILVQVSRDHKNWTDVQYITNAFHETPINSNAIYTTKDVELLSGCYYRVTVVYQVRRLIEEKNVLFVPIKEYEEKEIAEVYEFHAYNVDTYENLTDNDEKYSMGEKRE